MPPPPLPPDLAIARFVATAVTTRLPAIPLMLDELFTIASVSAPLPMVASDPPPEAAIRPLTVIALDDASAVFVASALISSESPSVTSPPNSTRVAASTVASGRLMLIPATMPPVAASENAFV